MQFLQFLILAKKHTYASNGEGGERILTEGGKELTYNTEDFEYKDRYFGFDPFCGQEVVWKNKKPIWSMNYYGKTTSDTVPAKQIYSFLQKAMQQVDEKRPFRGPDTFEEGDFSYIDQSRGDVVSFSGKETIHYKGELVYTLEYHGGNVLK